MSPDGCKVANGWVEILRYVFQRRIEGYDCQFLLDRPDLKRDSFILRFNNNRFAWEALLRV